MWHQELQPSQTRTAQHSVMEVVKMNSKGTDGILVDLKAQWNLAVYWSPFTGFVHLFGSKQITSPRLLLTDRDVLAPQLQWSRHVLLARIKFEVISLTFCDASEESPAITRQQINTTTACRGKHLETITNWPAQTPAHQSECCLCK